MVQTIAWMYKKVKKLTTLTQVIQLYLRFKIVIFGLNSNLKWQVNVQLIKSSLKFTIVVE